MIKDLLLVTSYVLLTIHYFYWLFLTSYYYDNCYNDCYYD